MNVNPSLEFFSMDSTSMGFAPYDASLNFSTAESFLSSQQQKNSHALTNFTGVPANNNNTESVGGGCDSIFEHIRGCESCKKKLYEQFEFDQKENAPSPASALPIASDSIQLLKTKTDQDVMEGFQMPKVNVSDTQIFDLLLLILAGVFILFILDSCTRRLSKFAK